jgi:hypothetical protein
MFAEPAPGLTTRPTMRAAYRRYWVRYAAAVWRIPFRNRFMTHLAMVEVDDEGNAATWGEHVSDEEYGAAPPIDR